MIESSIPFFLFIITMRKMQARILKKSNVYLRQIIVEFQNRNLKENDDAFL